MMQFFKKLHKWAGLLLGLQVLVWMLSGLAMSLLDPARVSGQEWSRVNQQKITSLAADELLEPWELPTEQLHGAFDISLETRHGRPVYHLRKPGGEALIDARNAAVLSFDQHHARRVAQADFSGAGEIAGISGGLAPDLETRDSQGRYWRVDFSDPARTSIYISAATGEILERRNNHWRGFDLAWMLHIMDYTGRKDFNNALVILVALAAIWLGISGVALLINGLVNGNFRVTHLWRRQDEVVVTLLEASRAGPRQLRLTRGGNLFRALAGQGVELPSVCGGGGNCGQCSVRLAAPGLPPPNSVEMQLVPAAKLKRGYRLACQQTLKRDLRLYLTREDTKLPD